MIKTLLIDNQLQQRKSLLKLLATFEEIEVIAEASSAEQGEELIKKLKPDLVFLDIDVPTTTCLNMLQKFEVIDFEVIFLATYPKYAIEAIKKGALDYLLKPIDEDELSSAINRYKEKVENRRERALDKKGFALTSKKMLLSLPKGYKLVNISDIVYCESSGRYTIFHPYNESMIVVAKNLGSFYEGLVEQGFVRIHDSYLINMLYFDTYNRESAKYGEVSLVNGVKLKVSRARKSKLLTVLKEYKIKS